MSNVDLVEVFVDSSGPEIIEVMSPGPPGPTGPTGPTGTGLTPIAASTLLGNGLGDTAFPQALNATAARTILGLATFNSPTFAGLTLSGLQSFTGTSTVGLRLKSLTSAEYNLLTPANGDLFVDSTTDRIDARLSRGTVELIDSAGGQVVTGGITVNGQVTSAAPSFGFDATLGSVRVNQDGGFWIGARSRYVSNASNQAVLRADGGVRSRNLADSADAPVTCSNLTASGTVTAGTASPASTTPLFCSAGSSVNGIAFYSSGTRVAFRADSQAAMYFGNGQNVIANGRPLGFEAGETGLSSATLSRSADGVLQIGTTANNALGSLLLTNLTASGTVAANTLSLSGADASANAIATSASGGITISRAGAAGCWIYPGDGRYQMRSDGYIGITSGSNPVSGLDTSLSRASAGVWQMGTTANNALGSLLLTNLTASGTVTASGTFIYGDTTNPFVRLSNAIGAQIGYAGGNRITCGGPIQISNSAGTERIRIQNGDCFFGVYTNAPQAPFHSVSSSTAVPAFIAQGVVSQTSPVFEIRNSAATVVASITDAGNLTASGTVTAGTLRSNLIQRNSGDTTLVLYNANFGVAGFCIQGPSGSYTNSSGVTGFLNINPIVNQTGTAGSTDIQINRTETALGSGAHNFANFQVGGTTRFRVSNAGAIQVGSTGALVTSILSATATLDFGSIGSNGTETLTITVTGAVAGDSVFLGCPAGLDAGLVFCASVTAANTVTVRMHNSSGGSIDPASGTFRATVIRF